MMVAYVETYDFENILNISTLKQGAMNTEVMVDNPAVDISKISGYTMYHESGKYRLKFDEEKYAKYIRAKQKEEAVKIGEALKEQLQENYILSMATDTDAYAMRYLYSEYAVGVTYHKGDRFMYQDKFYKVISANEFVSTEEWKPDISPSLYVEISDPNIEYPEFKQPINAETAYQKGDKITYKGEKYMSIIDNNAYSPDDYPAGWQKVE